MRAAPVLCGDCCRAAEWAAGAQAGARRGRSGWWCVKQKLELGRYTHIRQVAHAQGAARRGDAGASDAALRRCDRIAAGSAAHGAQIAPALLIPCMQTVWGGDALPDCPLVAAWARLRHSASELAAAPDSLTCRLCLTLSTQHALKAQRRCELKTAMGLSSPRFSRSSCYAYGAVDLSVRTASRAAARKGMCARLLRGMSGAVELASRWCLQKLHRAGSVHTAQCGA